MLIHLARKEASEGATKKFYSTVTIIKWVKLKLITKSVGTEILNFSIVKLYLNSDKLINLQTLWEREKSNEVVNFYAAISAQETKKQKQTKNKQTKSFTDLNRETVVYCEIKIKKQNNAKQKTKK